jgi:hypothetical protein
LQAVALVLPAPGTQSFTDEFVLGDARVSVWRPMMAPTALKAVSGKAASTDAAAPLLQGLKLQVCWAVPTVVKVPNGRSTWTVARPEESNMTQPLESGVPSRFASTVMEKPSCAIKFLLLVRVSSQRT